MTLSLAELQALCDQATPGPWYWSDEWDEVRAGCDTIIGAAPCGYENSRVLTSSEDLAFIIAARTAVPDLLARVRQLEAALGEALDCIDTGWPNPNDLGHIRKLLP